MLVIKSSQRNGVTVDWKVTTVKGYDETEWFKLAEPFQHLEVYLCCPDSKSIFVNSKQPLTVSISLINEDTKACMDLKETQRNELVEEEGDEDEDSDTEYQTGSVHTEIIKIGNRKLAFYIIEL